MTDRPDRDVVFTYRYLRGGMVAMLLMLLLSVVLQWWWGTNGTCWLGSISAYYFTPARTVFVGSLCALGAALVAYKGHSPAEDVLLNFSGFMAFVVAMVPTVPDERCSVSGTTNPFALSTSAISDAVDNNVWSLIVVGFLALVVTVWLRRDELLDPARRPPLRTMLVTVACSGVILFELVLFLVLPDRFVALSHGLAAATMVAGVIAVMVLSAFRVQDRHTSTEEARTYKRWYLAIAATLAVLLTVTVVAHLTVHGFDHVILIGEVIIIVLFCTYWVVQTKELWDVRGTAEVEARKVGAVAG
ncbi:hypothetical protein [Intrasporangium flavum]|uniref:hypothetical protein n=1 Tax=Intrasporangium flavum TaxID=1428657 RepID=UPI00096C34B2|nr:hypothetical protein [Intrasporangium flavum]